VRVPVLLLGLLSCGSPKSDAVRYAEALGEASDFESARSLCAGITDVGLRGDCKVGAMERHRVLDEAECDGVQSDLWRDECRFLLAERQRASGDLALAIDTCNSTRFARKCAWHLVQDEAQASVDEAPAVAEARITPFLVSRPVPDAALQFWIIRFREQAAAGKQLDERVCDEVIDRQTCVEGFFRHLATVLDALGRARLERVCAKDGDALATTGGEPAWAEGPLARAAESRWVRAHCPAP